MKCHSVNDIGIALVKNTVTGAQMHNMNNQMTLHIHTLTFSSPSISISENILEPSSSVRNNSNLAAMSSSSPRDRMPSTVLLMALKTPLHVC